MALLARVAFWKDTWSPEQGLHTGGHYATCLSLRQKSVSPRSPATAMAT